MGLTTERQRYTGPSIVTEPTPDPLAASLILSEGEPQTPRSGMKAFTVRIGAVEEVSTAIVHITLNNGIVELVPLDLDAQPAPSPYSSKGYL